MKALVKLGGTLVDEPESRQRLAAELAEVAQGVELAVVHGGGKQMTRFLAERGIESKFVNGLRVTTPEVVDALLKVFAGSVNHQLVAALQGAGAQAVGLTGLDAGLAMAEQLSPDLGAVGRIAAADPSILNHLLAGKFLPVVACVAGGRNGDVFNVNADQMAVAVAAAWEAEALIFLTDVEGVRDQSGAKLARLSVAECRKLIGDGVATGGMEAKLNAAMHAIERGVSTVVIAAGAVPGALRNVLSGAAVGTRIHCY